MYRFNHQDTFWNLARLLLVAVLITLVQPVHAERIKDLASIQGVRSNQLLGYGLVVGLDGSGDKAGSSPFTRQSLRSMLTQVREGFRDECERLLDVFGTSGKA